MESSNLPGTIFKKVKRILENFIYPILGGLYCFVFALVALLSTPIYLYRLLVIVLAKVFRPDLGEILNGQSAIQIPDYFSKHAPRANIVVCITVKGHLPKEEVRENMMMKNWICAIDKSKGDLKYKKFQQYPVHWMGFTFFKNAFETFDPDNHFHFHENLGNDIVTDQDANEFTEKLLNAPYKAKTSPWEIHLVHNYKSKQISPGTSLSLLILKLHHSLGDGYSILSAIVEGLCETPLSSVEMPIPKYVTKSTCEKLTYALAFPFTAFYELSYALSHTFKNNPWKIPDQKKCFHQYCAKSNLIPIKKIKEIKNKFGVSFTSVLLSAISAASHKNLEGKKKNKEITPEEDAGSLFCFTALPLLSGRSGTLTNHSTGAFFDIPTVKFENPARRLRHLEWVLEKTKNSVIPYLVRFYILSIGCHLARVCAIFGENRIVTVGLTNFPSIPIRITRCKANTGLAVDFAAGTLQGTTGVGIMVLSYNQFIRVNATAEKAVMSKEELNQFVNDIVLEIDLLHDKIFATRLK